MRGNWTPYLFHANAGAHLLLLVGAVWCIAYPSDRIYPMREKNVWHWMMWALFLFVFTSNAVFFVADWNSGLWSSSVRYWAEVPIVALGVAVLVWGIATLGFKNTSALRDGFVAQGPYLISRNPQYVADFFIFMGLTIVANSRLLLVTHILTSLVFLVGVIAEESWLETEYGSDYRTYRGSVPRFL